MNPDTGELARLLASGYHVVNKPDYGMDDMRVSAPDKLENYLVLEDEGGDRKELHFEGEDIVQAYELLKRFGQVYF